MQRPPIFEDKTQFSSSGQHFWYIEAVKPQVSYMFEKGFTLLYDGST